MANIEKCDANVDHYVEPTEQQHLGNELSDAFKLRYGHRPRHYDFEAMTEEELREELKSIYKIDLQGTGDNYF